MGRLRAPRKRNRVVRVTGRGDWVASKQLTFTLPAVELLKRYSVAITRLSVGRTRHECERTRTARTSRSPLLLRCRRHAYLILPEFECQKRLYTIISSHSGSLTSQATVHVRRRTSAERCSSWKSCRRSRAAPSSVTKVESSNS